jgi:hypothetical protein
LRSDVNGVRLSAGLRDPWFLGRELSLDVRASGDGERGEWMAVAQNRERSVLDRTTLEARVGGAAFAPSALRPGDYITFEAFRRTQASLLAARRIARSGGAVLGLSAGAAYERAEYEPLLAGPSTVLREFVGAGLGLRRRSVSYDTATWVLPANAIVDIPLSFEFDALAHAGRDLASGRPATRLDAWAGHMWLPTRTTLVAADAWMSGYHVSGTAVSSMVRGSIHAERAATRGVWVAQIEGERWTAPDPDMRSLVLSDPTIPALGESARWSGAAGVASLERDVRLRTISRSWAVDAAVFGAASHRVGADVAVVGLGLRMVPTRMGRVTARLDVGVPVWRAGDVRTKPFIGIGITPWFDQDRQRDGRRSR